MKEVPTLTKLEDEIYQATEAYKQNIERYTTHTVQDFVTRNLQGVDIVSAANSISLTKELIAAALELVANQTEGSIKPWSRKAPFSSSDVQAETNGTVTTFTYIYSVREPGGEEQFDAEYTIDTKYWQERAIKDTSPEYIGHIPSSC